MSVEAADRTLPGLGSVPAGHGGVWAFCGLSWVLGDPASTVLALETGAGQEANETVQAVLEAVGYGPVGYAALFGMKLASLVPLVVIYRLWPDVGLDRNLVRHLAPAIPAAWGFALTASNLLLVVRWWL